MALQVKSSIHSKKLWNKTCLKLEECVLELISGQHRDIEQAVGIVTQTLLNAYKTQGWFRLSSVAHTD